MLENLLTYLTQPVATLFGPVITVVLGFLVGRRKTVHDRLYEERAKVVASLFERFESVDQRFYSLIKPYDQAGEPNKREKAKLAVESFNELQSYYRCNSIWLSRGTSSRVKSFVDEYRQVFKDYDTEDIQKWLDVWKSFEKESPEIKERLETEFRAALGYRGATVHRFWVASQRQLPRWFRRRQRGRLPSGHTGGSSETGNEG